MANLQGRRLCLSALAASAALAFAASAGAAEKVVTMRGAPAPGPARYDRVFVTKFGPASARNVLVLMPGTIAGAGDFTLTGRYLVRKVPGLQVWAVDRRSQALEDTSMFAKALSGRATPQQAFDYYLGGGGYTFVDTSALPFARDWGMKVALDDVRRVVQAARRGGRTVFLGGHSLGASLTAAYAAWDFGGRPGYRDIAGMILIDGGLLGSFDAYNLAQARQQIDALSTGNPFADLINVGVPEATGLFAEIGGVFARLAPAASAQMLQDYPLLPDRFDPGYPVTDRGLLGYAFDRDTSPAELSLIHVNAGRLAGGGQACAAPCDWVDGGVTPIARLAATFGQEPSNGVEWFFPRRLTIDTNGADQMRQNRVARFLGLRLEHTAQIHLPLYAIQTDLAGADVLGGARNLIRRSAITRREATLVNADPLFSHLDPLTAAPAKNRFFKTIVPFLKRNMR
jgi:pimeloyl-ACP methyl ester carboxylesterase